MLNPQPTSEREREGNSEVYRVMDRTKYSQCPIHILKGTRTGWWGKEEIKSAVPQSFGHKDARAQ